MPGVSVCPHLDHPWVPRCWYLTECVHQSWALVDPIRPRGRARTLGGPPSDPGSVGMGSHSHQTRGGGGGQEAPIRPRGWGVRGTHQTWAGGGPGAPIRPKGKGPHQTQGDWWVRSGGVSSDPGESPHQTRGGGGGPGAPIRPKGKGPHQTQGLGCQGDPSDLGGEGVWGPPSYQRERAPIRPSGSAWVGGPPPGLWVGGWAPTRLEGGWAIRLVGGWAPIGLVGGQAPTRLVGGQACIRPLDGWAPGGWRPRAPIRPLPSGLWVGPHQAPGKGAEL